ncbi:MAG: ferrous iron transport protein A [Clostridiales bacterium]|nr:ferrous iron transport protein A [Clostridiales bacterium]
MTLNKINRGQRFKIKNINEKSSREQAIRLGLFEGAYAKCIYKLPYGPIIVKAGMQEIAIGRNLAKNIIISV